MSSSAPKFASFRPKPKVPEQPPSVEPRHKDNRHRKPGSKAEEERGQRTTSSLPGESERFTPHEPGRDEQEVPHRAYFSDRRGDLNIVKYGTPNQYDIPRYRRSGYGNILGLPGQKIDRDYSTDKKIYVIPLARQRQKRMLTEKHAAKEAKSTLRLVKIEETHHTDATCDFIAFPSVDKRKRGSGSGSEEDDGATEVDYRGIEEKKQDPDMIDEADTYYELDTKAGLANSKVMQKNSRLIRETRDEPENLQAWLDLVEHQEPMMKLDRAISEFSVADKQNLADVRISTYEEALRRIGNDDFNQIELHAGLLREAQRVWDGAKVATKWQAVLEKFPYSAKLWFGYLDFIQSTFTNFRYEDCRAIYLQALKAMRSTNTDNTLAGMHLFVRLTTMIQQAGYQELALAVWQAVLEFKLLAPHGLVANKVQNFEEFWESEAPRIGEPNCKGWRHTLVDDAVPPACTIILQKPDLSDSPLSGFRRRELDSIDKLRYPGRSTDDVGEDDPFHTILFSDLEDLLTHLPNSSPEVQIDAFLCFCGLPKLVTERSDAPWRSDPYLQSRDSYSGATAQAGAEIPRYSEISFRYSQTPLANFQMTRDLLVQQDFSLQPSRLSLEFVRTTLKLLAMNDPDSDCIGEYLLAFESRHFPSDFYRSAKRLLKSRPSSLRLYNMYGVAEGHWGNSSKADQIFAAALNINSRALDRLELLNTYIWQALHDNNRVEALQRLVHYARESSPVPSEADPVAIEAARAALQISLEDALLGQQYASAVLNANHLALLVYLSSDCNASAALEVHSNLVAWFASHKMSSSMHAETHAQAVARLLAYHVTHTSIVKPALLRTALEPLIATFPDNTILLSTYAANEARFAIDDRVHGNMHRVLNISSPDASVATWIFAIYHETLKGEAVGSTSHSIRALFKRATNIDASGAHCPAIWKMYVQFELKQWFKEQDMRPNKRMHRDGKKSMWETRLEEAGSRLKQTFYHGLRMLPWCKDFIMLAFTDARDTFSEEELWRLYRVMMEKELRVYTDVEDQRP
ncbi:hypothetical protein SVAN01_11058 [Stagonosporopsis vannaccii]|nr:hypothetical protein SVAN01_11058 [Stagonosporopsis vannaccii]